MPTTYEALVKNGIKIVQISASYERKISDGQFGSMGGFFSMTADVEPVAQIEDQIDMLFSFVRDAAAKQLKPEFVKTKASISQAADRAVNVEAPNMTNVPQAPTAPVAPQATAAPTGPMTAQCVMIEVGTSYQGGKTQLKFNCNGIEHPLTYTKEISDMVKLLAPLGFTAAHIVVGQKYPVNCVVTYAETSKDGKTYKNVQNVKAA